MLLPSYHKAGRGDWIRTSGLYVPNVALYQAEPHLEKCGPKIGAMAAEEGFEPSQTESESVVLPLHNPAVSRPLSQAQDLLYQNNSICQVFLQNYLPDFFLTKARHSFIIWSNISKSEEGNKTCASRSESRWWVRTGAVIPGAYWPLSCPPERE